MDWEQLVYGKLVQSTDGPIVPRLDYRVTGSSPAYPADLVAQSHPNRTGLNAGDLFNWERYPWNVGGGFIVRSTVSREGPMVIAGRIRGRSEKGEAQPGRYYVQSHYAVASAATWSPAAIVCLPELLRANPMTTEDRQMPQLRLDDHLLADWLDRPLQPRWLDGIAQPLAAVMSSCAYSVQDWHAKLEDYLATFALCACAVPAALAWRLSIGAGVAEMRGDVALALGQAALSGGVRVIGGKAQGADAPELDVGRRYVGWLRQCASECRTPRQLRQTIDQALPNFAAPFAIAPKADWRDAAQLIATTVVERIRLDEFADWLNARTETRPEVRFELFRDQALDLVLRNFDRRGLQLVTKFIAADWSDAWGRAAAAASATAGLAGAFARLTEMVPDSPRVSDVDRFADLPLAAPLVTRVQETLDRALRDGRLGADWASKLGAAHRPPWLADWFARSGDAWFWRAVEHARQTGDLALLDALRATENRLLANLHVLEARDTGSDYRGAAEALVRSAPRSRTFVHDPDGVDWIMGYLLRKGRILAALALAHAGMRSLPVATAATPMTSGRGGIDPDCVGRALAEELEQRPGEPLNQPMLKLLLTTPVLPRMSNRLQDALASRLGYPIAEILLSGPRRIPAQPSPPDASALAKLAFTRNAALIDRAWEELCRGTTAPPGLEPILRSWLSDSRVAAATQSEAVRFVARLWRGERCDLPNALWRDEEAYWIRFLLSGDRQNLIVAAIAAADNENQLLNGLNLVLERICPPLRSKKLFSTLVEHRAGGCASPVLDRLRFLHLQQKPVWRLLFLPWDGLRQQADGKCTAAKEGDDIHSQTRAIRATSEEIELITSLPKRMRLWLLALGVRYPSDFELTQLSPTAIEDEHFSAHALGELARTSNDLTLTPLLIATTEVLLRRVRRSPADFEELAADLDRHVLGRLMDRIKRKDVSDLVSITYRTLNLLPLQMREAMLLRQK
jgi:hypothetical protein